MQNNIIKKKILNIKTRSYFPETAHEHKKAVFSIRQVITVRPFIFIAAKLLNGSVKQQIINLRLGELDWKTVAKQRNLVRPEHATH